MKPLENSAEVVHTNIVGCAHLCEPMEGGLMMVAWINPSRFYLLI